MRGGPVVLSNDGAVLVEGKPVRLYGASIASDGADAVVDFRDGDEATDTLIFQGTGADGKTVLVEDIPAEGILFPNGLYLVLADEATACTVWVEQAGKN